MDRLYFSEWCLTHWSGRPGAPELRAANSANVVTPVVGGAAQFAVVRPRPKKLWKGDRYVTSWKTCPHHRKLAWYRQRDRAEAGGARRQDRHSLLHAGGSCQRDPGKGPGVRRRWVRGTSRRDTP